MAISIAPSGFWDGNDGLWNSFIVSVGTPGQEFRVFPSTAGQETWIPVPQGCTSSDPEDCAYLRGALPFDGKNSSGFDTTASSSWNLKGIFTLDAQEAKMGYDGNGLFGTDVVTWGNGTDSANLEQQTVAGIADKDFYLGLFGLGPKVSNFTDYNDRNPSFLSTLYNDSKIPSLSWGYTAGAAYRNQLPASLTLGGYDSNRVSGQQLSIDMNSDNSRPLQIGLQGIFASNTFEGTLDLGYEGTYHFVDSTLSHIWLPSETIDGFVSAFGLTYDNTTDLFLVNDSVHDSLLQMNPTVSFQIGADTQGSDTITINLPYAAFDLQASYPFYENATNYFPIRRAANESQYTIGRTFLQEAYIVADYLRNNFSVAQANHEDTSGTNIVSIEKPTENNNTSNGTTIGTPTPRDDSSGISGGAIAGIVIGVVAVIAILGLGFWFYRRKQQQKHKHTPVATTEPEQSTNADVFPEDKKDGFEQRASELPGPQLHEMAAQSKNRFAEVDGASSTKSPLHSPSAFNSGHPSPRFELGHGGVDWVAEAPGSESHRYELPGAEIARDQQNR
ncbi:acid protease [Polychaeton citri CBS 116435]|uniref:Acid protease n=1 Tax=Polychaeton citri CBS 116435 TaxID=1314669 RepID=A0A9P4Q5E6_9PEZI|nr:acid protease [Polychaeton citri CBS 116435]